MHSDDWTRADAIAMTVLARCGGVARIGAFLAAGLTRYQVAAIFRRGVITRPRNAWYADPALPWQARRAIRVGGVLCCVTAADSWGLPVPPGAHARLHVEVPHNSPRIRHNRDKRHLVVPGEDAEVVLHWAAVDGARTGWRTTLPETIRALAGCVPIEWWIAAVDAALHRPRCGVPLMSPEELHELREILPEHLLIELGRCDPLAGSCIETLLRLGMIRRGIGPLVLQFSPTANQFVDFLLPGKLIVEVDGAAFHDPAEDAARDARFRGLGYRVLRFSYERVVGDLERVLDEIEAALAAGSFFIV